MTEQSQRIAIAEACGLRPNPILRDHHRWIIPSARTDGGDLHVDLPDYLHDLNAMHAAEKALKDSYETEIGSRGLYISTLNHISGDNFFGCIHATAAQRAEAFLRTIGKWEEKK